MSAAMKMTEGVETVKWLDRPQVLSPVRPAYFEKLETVLDGLAMRSSRFLARSGAAHAGRDLRFFRVQLRRVQISTLRH